MPRLLYGSGQGNTTVGCLGEIDDIVLLATAGLGAAEMDGERGEGRTVPSCDRRLDSQLLATQAGDFAAAVWVLIPYFD